jgi:hypothetical protein
MDLQDVLKHSINIDGCSLAGSKNRPFFGSLATLNELANSDGHRADNDFSTFL